VAISNALLVRFGDGYHEVIDQDSINAHGRKEGFLQLGAAQTEEDVDRICEALFERLGWAQVATTMAIDPTLAGDVPNIDFRKGDYLPAPDETGGTSSQRVRAVTTTVEPETGKLIHVIELRDAIEEETERLERWLKRLANGALGGTTNQPSPAVGGTGGGQLESISFGELPPFSFPGPISTDLSGHYRPIAATRIVRWSASLRVAGSTSTTVALKINGSTVDTITLGAADQYESENFAVDVSTGTIVQVEVTAAGTDAEDLLVQIITGT